MTAEPSLTEESVDPDPIRQFAEWYAAGMATNVINPNAMTLATTTVDGQPSARMVLLKGFDERGFVFYTNYESRKGRELAENPRAALVFYWDALHRQVRIQGEIERVSPEESDAYFASRPRGSQIGAAASRQSTVIPDRTLVESRAEQLTKEYADRDIPRPEYWGGYRVKPSAIEFWQGQPDRLHDRLRYTRKDDGWRMERLSP